MSHLLLYALPSFITDNEGLLITLLIGAIAGYLAEYLVPGPGYGFLVTIIIGMAGGWLGSIAFKGLINISTDIPHLNEVISATLGDMIVVIVVNLIMRAARGGKGNGSREKNVYDWENE